MPMLTNSNRTKKRLFLGFTAGFLAINGGQGIYQALLMNRRKRQFRTYLKNAPEVRFGNFHRGSVYGYKHIRSSQNVYFAVRQLSDERFIVRRHAQIWTLPESYAITDFDYNFLSDFAYYVDDQMAKQDFFEPIVAGDALDERFQVIRTIDDETGMQAMAVQVSRTQIVIAYAGTNPLDARDLKMDMTTIVAKQNLPSSENQQHQKAELFYQAVQADYPDLTITLTGHSLGGFLALYVACRKNLDATVYNAPDPCQLLGDMSLKQELELKNYRHVYDAMGNFAGNGTGAEVFSNRRFFLARTPFVYHGIASWRFDSNGKIER
ncbi:Mbeg1-like protein [Lactococcus reticulitermitis]